MGTPLIRRSVWCRADIPPSHYCCYLTSHASVGSNTGLSPFMRPLPFTSNDKLIHRQGGTSGIKSHAGTYGGKCVAQRRAQFATVTTQGKLVKLSLVLVGHFGCLPNAPPLPPPFFISQQDSNLRGERGEQKQHRRHTAVFSVL